MAVGIPAVSIRTIRTTCRPTIRPRIGAAHTTICRRPTVLHQADTTAHRRNPWRIRSCAATRAASPRTSCACGGGRRRPPVTVPPHSQRRTCTIWGRACRRPRSNSTTINRPR
ncbi:unnamed protein product [Acanthoscelides obtectus]|uniref:Uncharacterized protein n=1 Tax=Acanthoscelides obtectus TaxID=200917 RepID=A0A9P0MCJ5_ACAOB|nr:unnamed protein product [Acanthoscelides obtectus]CAK1630324.1 hypothetical protein AOBTE_LOCUS6263 [Acanthoscelides obtectus]